MNPLFKCGGMSNAAFTGTTTTYFTSVRAGPAWPIHIWDPPSHFRLRLWEGSTPAPRAQQVLLHELLPLLTSAGREGLKLLLEQVSLAGAWVGTSVISKKRWDVDLKSRPYLAARQHLKRWLRSTQRLRFTSESFREAPAAAHPRSPPPRRYGSLPAEAEAWLLIARRARATPCRFQVGFMCCQVVKSCN